MGAHINDVFLFESIYACLTEGILVVDQSGILIRVNPSAEKMFGYSSGELINQKVEVLIAEKLHASHKFHRENFIKNPHARPLGKGLELSGKRKDGSIFPVEISLNPIKIEENLVVICVIVDITERLTLQRTVKKKDHEMQVAQDLAEVGSWRWNALSNVANFSDQFYKIYGLQAGDKRLNITSVYDSLHPDDSKMALELMEKASAKKKAYHIEYRIIGFDGKIRHVIAKGSAVLDNKDKVIGKIGTIQDISARIKTNMALLESERRIKTLINNVPGVVYQSKNSKNWEVFFISEGCFTLTGYHANEFIEGKINFGELIIDEDKNQVWNTIQKAIKKKESYNVMFGIKTKKGQLKYIWRQGEGVFDMDGNLIALEGFIQDITKQRKLAFDLKSFEAKNKAILLAIPDLLFVQDYFGNFLEVYVQNPEKLFLPKDQIIGKNMKDVLPVDMYRIINKIQKQTIKSKKVQITEYTYSGDNRVEHYEARIVPLNHKGLLTIVRDVTDKKDVEQSLKIKNQALEAAGNGILIIDAKLPDLPIIYCNDSFVKMTGYSKEDALGRNCRFLQNDDRDQEAIQVMRTAINQGKPCHVILRNYRKDGSLFWNELTITPIYNDNGDLTHFIGVQNDITVRKKEELLSDEIRKILEMITQNKPIKEISDLIVKTAEENLKNSRLAILLFDQNKQSLHYLSGSNLPENFIKAIDGVSVESISCCCTQAIKNKEEVIREDITQEEKWVEFNKNIKHPFLACWSFPILSAEKEVLGTFSVYYDYPKTPEESEKLIITDLVRLASVAIEQNNTNEMLQKSREQLEKYTLKLEEEVRFRTEELMATVKKLVESNLNFEDQIQETKLAENRALSNQQMFLTIAKNFPKGAIAVINNDYKIEYIEGRELDNLNLKGEDLQGLSVDDIGILDLGQKEGIKNVIFKTLSGAHLTYEVEFKKNNYVVNTTPLYSHEDAIQQALFVYSNISEQKQIELEILEALRKEQELNELKSRFISLASHEFRTPLSAILSSANLISKQPNDQEERRKKYVSIIKSNVKSLVTILNDFLSLSKLEEGKVLSQPITFELIEFSKSIIEEIEPSKKEGQVILFNSEMKEVEVFFDPKIIRHVLTNLVSNAIKYSNQQDEIAIYLHNNEKNVILEVTDHGIGIPLDEQNNLFDRFFRARNAVNINGIGLGLYIVKQYIELIGGTITFESTLNKGTTFFVELPINQNK